jgi:hypothetical protein
MKEPPKGHEPAHDFDGLERNRPTDGAIRAVCSGWCDTIRTLRIAGGSFVRCARVRTPGSADIARTYPSLPSARD